jgi:hypothetical protein
MEALDTRIRKAFPCQEVFLDCAGTPRKFTIEMGECLSEGYLLSAREITDYPGGYEFRAFSATSPFEALGRLQLKIRRGLATKYLLDHEHILEMTHDRVKGYISPRGLVVDGKLISWEQLRKLLTSQEGLSIDIRVFEDAD